MSPGGGGGGLPEVMTSANNFTLVAPHISNPHVYMCREGHWAPCSCNPFFELPSRSVAKLGDLTKGHFTHEPRAVTG